MQDNANFEEAATEVESNEAADTNETAGGRLRTSAGSNLRRRNAIKRRGISDLPPFDLPNDFIAENVSYFGPDTQPRLPKPLEMDATHVKVSNLYSKATPQRTLRLEEYFTAAVDMIEKRLAQIWAELEGQPILKSSPWHTSFRIAQIVRLTSFLNDCAWHLADALYPVREPTYTYTSRPFWWWNIYRDLDPQSYVWRDHFTNREAPVSQQLQYAEYLDHSLSHAITDFPIEAFNSLKRNLRRDLEQICPPSFDPKIGRRPIQILAMHGHDGKSIAQSLGSYASWLSEAHVVHLDAYDISWMLGDYIGQDWLYSRGPVSTLGFRAADYGGRTGRRIQIIDATEEDPDDEESNIIHVRNAADLRKLRQDLSDDVRDSALTGLPSRSEIRDVFTDWEHLKINKALETLVSKPTEHLPVTDLQQPVVVHVHDYIELSMTLEGAAILSKLRQVVDIAWKNGKRIVLLGTSSSQTPSDEYHNMVRELAASDFVVSRAVQPARAEAETATKLDSQAGPFNLQLVDNLCENARNINRMILAIDPPAHPMLAPLWRVQDNPDDGYWHDPMFQGAPRNPLNSTVLPWLEIHNLARSFRDQEISHPGTGASAFADRMHMGPLLQPPGHGLRWDAPSDANGKRESSSGNEASRPESTANAANKNTARGGNEYEKRIANGIINKENLRTTFADIHVAPEITTALKLLTSLALVRPDAFSYGVLAHDKINGCLLYGPPGTGKTMLAKAVAKDSGANMLEVSGASINDKWVGESEKLIRAVFTMAKKMSPCVIFIDEADSILSKRSMHSTRPAHRELINQFLKEWDGMEETNAFIMVATNRPFDLDDAVLRRLPRKLLIDLPLKNDRSAIIKLLLRDERLADDVDMASLAELTPYYSGSDLKNMCVAAAMTAVEQENAAAEKHTGPEPYEYPERRILDKSHFEKALKQIPASISEDMESLRLIKRFDEEYGNRRKGGKKKTMGFGGGELSQAQDSLAARVRQTGDQPDV
ncbi:AAA+-type ATPase [Emericellopsis cladophorae]|uniref:AAA+-type ATPase n=1 Tax=Emericellopsis cladophorae TaxID=2686198 RepID=A0A9Q0BE28_9HYPO|nr:AAA+-type ATPase [Emericellopsis cladophorae]KAI6782002.1 AAA+-type ATPase [Emericellopsis cladophorae]